MNLELAKVATEEAIKEAKIVGGKYCVAIMDSGVNLVHFSRMDGARVGTIDVAMKKVKRRLNTYSIQRNLLSDRCRRRRLRCLRRNQELLLE